MPRIAAKHFDEGQRDQYRFDRAAIQVGEHRDTSVLQHRRVPLNAAARAPMDARLPLLHLEAVEKSVTAVMDLTAQLGESPCPN